MKKTQAIDTPPIPKRAFKVSEAAALLGIQPVSIRRLIARGDLTPCRVLRHLLISEKEIERLLNN
jgi:excisionase family DNA binding protein